MTALRSGWNMPPGCFRTPADEPDPPCAVCCRAVDDCVCPECKVCGEVGDQRCYLQPGDKDAPANPHAMKLNKAQVRGREEARVALLQEQIADIGQYLAWLEDQPDTFTTDLSESMDPYA